MTIPFGALFADLARIASAFRNVIGLMGTNEPSPSSSWGLTVGGMSGGNIHCLDKMLTNIQTRVGQSYPELMSGGNYRVSGALYQLQTSLPGAVAGALNYFQSLAQGLIMDVVNRDMLIPNLTIQIAMTELVRQMVANSQSVHWNTLSSTTTAGGSNIGNPTIVVTFVDANGNNLQYAYNETLVLTTTQDASDGATAGNETISIAAPAGGVSPSLDYRWPSGNGFCSGFQGSMTVVDPLQSNGSGGNLLNNSSFKGTWTSNQPQYWTADVGSAGTNWQDGTSNNYLTGAHCFEFLGDGSTLASIYQTFANGSVTGGNTSSLTPETVYLFRLMYKLSSASPAAGVLSVSLTDTSGTVITDNVGNANTITLALTGVSDTSYHALTGSFRTPANLPTTGVRLRLKLTTALTNAVNLFIDGMALAKPQQGAYGGIYAGGPYIAAFRGDTDTVDFVPNPGSGDRWTVAITNDYNGLWQMWLWQTMNLPAMGLVIPNAASPTQPDSLLVI